MPKKTNHPNKQEVRTFTAHSTVSQNRLPLFLPILRSSGWANTNNRQKIRRTIFNNTHGTCEVSAILTQTHKNIIEALFAVREKLHISKEGYFTVGVRTRRLFEFLNITRGSHNWVQEKLKEIASARISFTNRKKGLYYNTAIISEFGYSKHRHEVQSPRQRGLLFVTFSRGFMSMFFNELQIRYAEDTLKKIISLKTGVEQALVRYCLSHKEVHNSIDNVLREIGVHENISEQHKRDIKSALRKNREALKEHFGITIGDDGTMHYQQQKNKVFIEDKIDTKFLPKITEFIPGQDNPPVLR